MYTVEQLLVELTIERECHGRTLDRYVEDFTRHSQRIATLEKSVTALEQENIILMETLAEERKRNEN